MEPTAADSTKQAVIEQIKNLGTPDGMNQALESLSDMAITAGGRILTAILVYIIGRWIIRWTTKMITKITNRKSGDKSIILFVRSLVNISMTIILLIIVVGILGLETSGFVALFATAGMAIGMALSGNLSNFAGGMVILLFRPFKVGDFITTGGDSGSVAEIQIFSSILTTPDNRTIIVPNSQLATGVVTNFSTQTRRRVDWIVGIEYGEDYDKAKAVLDRLMKADKRILPDPAYAIMLTSLSASSVDIEVRAWVNPSDYWDVYFGMNELIYKTFNEEGIGFPFPQLTVHQAQD